MTHVFSKVSLFSKLDLARTVLSNHDHVTTVKYFFAILPETINIRKIMTHPH